MRVNVFCWVKNGRGGFQFIKIDRWDTSISTKEKNHVYVTPLQVSPYFTHEFINPKESTFCRSIILQWQQRSRQSTSNKFDISPLADKCVSCFSRQRYAQLNGKWSPWEPISGPQPTHVGIIVRARVWCSTPFENQMPAGALSSRVWQRKSVLFPNGNGKKHISHIFERMKKKRVQSWSSTFPSHKTRRDRKKSRRPYKRPSQSVSSSSPKPLPTAASTTTPAGFGLGWSPGKYAKKGIVFRIISNGEWFPRGTHWWWSERVRKSAFPWDGTTHSEASEIDESLDRDADRFVSRGDGYV